MVIYLSGVVVMAFAILYFNWGTLRVLTKEKTFWLAMMVMAFTSWAGVFAAVVIYLLSKYGDFKG